MPAWDSSFTRSGSRLFGSQPTCVTCLNPLGAPMSALESLGPFFLPFLSFLLLLDDRDETGEGIERYRDDWMSGFWMSTVAM